VPYIRAGNFAALRGSTAKMSGLEPAMSIPAFWNVAIAK
jgi:peptide/nickel transport system substrate-binding protein